MDKGHRESNDSNIVYRVCCMGEEGLRKMVVRMAIMGVVIIVGCCGQAVVKVCLGQWLQGSVKFIGHEEILGVLVARHYEG